MAGVVADWESTFIRCGFDRMALFSLRRAWRRFKEHFFEAFLQWRTVHCFPIKQWRDNDEEKKTNRGCILFLADKTAAL